MNALRKKFLIRSSYTLRLSFTSLLLAFSGCCTMPASTEDPVFQSKYSQFAYCGFETTKQSRNTSCGSACLVSVLKYWGNIVSEEEIFHEFPVPSEEGYSVVDLKNIAKRNSLDAYALTMQRNPLVQLEEQVLKGRPVICAVRFPWHLYFAYDVPIYGQTYRTLAWIFGPRKNHYIVVFGIKDDKFMIMDPAYGFVTLSQKQFERCWSRRAYGVVLCAKKSNES